MRILDMYSFVVLARLRHFARAARELNATQPAISTRLATLETELGVTLVRRSGRDFSLTPEGERVLKTFDSVLSDIDQMMADLRHPADVPQTIRIGAIDAISTTWMPPLVEALHQRAPHVKVELTIESTRSLVEDLQRGHFDVIFALEPVLGETYRSFIACVFAMGWVGAQRVIDPARTYSVEDLAQLPIVTFPRDTPPYRMIAPYFQDEMIMASKLTSSNSLFSIINLVIEGFGIGALPTIAVQREMRMGLLHAVRTTKPLSAMPVICTYQAVTNTGLVQLAVEQTRQCAAEFCAGIDADLAWVR